MRIVFGVEYNGSRYFGWQRQSHEPNTVQETLETAIAFVANEPIKTYCAGRTDRGVHGVAQVIHFDTDAVRSERSWQLGVNSQLPETIRVLWVRQVDDSFHARFSAKSRRYCYVLYEDSQRRALLSELATFYRGQLDVEAMNMAAQQLLGEQDFSSFRAANCQAKHAVRTIETISVTRENGFIVFDIQANSFLYHMVRNIVGALLAVGSGEQDSAWFAKLIAAQNRQLAPAMAAPTGLYLVAIGYDACYNLPTQNHNFYFKEL